MPPQPIQRGLYLITPDERDGERLLERTLPLLPYAACLQLRCKRMDAMALRVVATRLRDVCVVVGVPLIVNDDVALAHHVQAHGVHLGAQDAVIADARRQLGDDVIIGASCYGDLERARNAVAAGASYVAFGAFFPSPTKPHAPRADIALLRDSTSLGVPRVAIGGITPDNAGPLVAAGADLLAVISGVFDAADPAAAARAYRSLFRHERLEDPTP